MKKCLIIPYYGEFPETFPLWLQSCRSNSDIDWIIVTDNEICWRDTQPDNIKIIKKSFGELKEYFQRKFEFKICLDRPYKLCHYKPFYGYLFEEYLTEYDFWGFCDMDTIWGRISAFLPEELFFSNDKILDRGHLSFVRTRQDINENFKKYDNYKFVLSHSKGYEYDESWYGFHLGFNAELKESGYRVYDNKTLYSDVSFRYKPFRVPRVVGGNGHVCVFVYENGHLYRIEQDATREETMYAHFQKSKVEMRTDIDENHYLIYPNIITSDFSVLEKIEFWENVNADLPGYWNAKEEKRKLRMISLNQFMSEPHKMKFLIYKLRNRFGFRNEYKG